MLNAPVQASTSLLENGELTDAAAWSLSYVTLGYGHGEEWWRAFCYRLRMAVYDGWLSIEHEDVMLRRSEGLTKSVTFLKIVAPNEAATMRRRSSEAPQGAAVGSGRAPFGGRRPALGSRPARPSTRPVSDLAARAATALAAPDWRKPMGGSR